MKGVDADSRSSSGRTPLSWAAQEGFEAVVRLLLEQHGVDVDNEDVEYHQTPLGRAAEMGHETVVRLLLENGAKVEAKTAAGWTALDCASFYGHKVIVQLLKSKNQSS